MAFSERPYTRYDQYRPAVGSPREAESQQPADAPLVCPECRSAETVTTAKAPDIDSYWRCKQCGLIWNRGRWKDQRGWRQR